MPKGKKKVLINKELPVKEAIKSSLKVCGRTYNAEGQTIQEAITNLKPEIVRGVGVLTLESGAVSKWKIINPRIINGLYGKYVSHLSKEIALKNILMLFDKIL